jgi:hypothetical protein
MSGVVKNTFSGKILTKKRLPSNLSAIRIFPKNYSCLYSPFPIFFHTKYQVVSEHIFIENNKDEHPALDMEYKYIKPKRSNVS